MSQLFKLKNGTVLLSTEVPGGVYNSVQLKKIAELCSRELAVVKATEDQRLALFVKESEVQQVAQQLRSIGLGFRNYQRGLHQPVTCLGELCEQHDQPALVTSMEVTKQIENLNLDAPLKIGINGCAHCCTPCHTLDISVVGEPSGYRLSMGGKNSQVPELATFFAENIPAKELPGLVKKVLALYRDKAEVGESLPSVLDRCGVADFVAALAPYSQDAAQREDPFEGGEGALRSEPALDELALEGAVDQSQEDQESPDEGFEAAALVEEEQEIQQDCEPEESVAEMEEIPIHSGHDHALDDEVPLHGLSSQAGETDVQHLTEDLPLQDEPELVKDLDSEVLELVEDELVTEEESEGEELLPEVDSADTEVEVALDDTDEVVIVTDDDDVDLDVAMEATDEVPELDRIDDDDTGLGAELALARELDPESSESMPELSEAPMTTEEQAGKSLAEADPELEASLPTSDHELSDEEETAFERKLEASIAEESRLLASEDGDLNSDERQEALELLEHDDTIDPDLERERSLADHTLEQVPIDEDLDEVDIAPEIPKASSQVSAPVRVAPTGKGFRLAAVSFEGPAMRLTFESGAYVDVDLGSLHQGEDKTFFIGHQRITVTQQEGGYTLETDGVKMFYPKGITAA